MKALAAINAQDFGEEKALTRVWKEGDDPAAIDQRLYVDKDGNEWLFQGNCAGPKVVFGDVAKYIESGRDFQIQGPDFVVKYLAPGKDFSLTVEEFKAALEDPAKITRMREEEQPPANKEWLLSWLRDPNLPPGIENQKDCRAKVFLPIRPPWMSRMGIRCRKCGSIAEYMVQPPPGSKHAV